MYKSNKMKLQEKLQKMSAKGRLISFYDYVRLASWKMNLPYHTIRMLLKLKFKRNRISRLNLICYLNSQKGFTQRELGILFQIPQSSVAYHIERVSKVWEKLQFIPSSTVEEPCSYNESMESYIKERF